MKSLFTLCIALLSSVALSAQGFGERVSINEDWHFNLGDIKYGGVEFYDHSDWREVDLPHDWSVEQVASPTYAACTGFYPGGIGWYRKDLKIDASRSGERVYIYFEGVYNNSEVFINGKWIGKRPNGYISFMYDLTPYINFGGRNVIAVRVDHSDDADSRWYTGSGIYRGVHLVYAKQTHINLWGASYTAKIEELTRAEVSVRCEVKSYESKSRKLKARFTLEDRDGGVVAQAESIGTTDSEEIELLTSQMVVENPRLWSIDDPYLYTLRTELYSGSKLLDATRCNVGLRKLTFDPNEGFALNDKSMKLKGLCMHHDAGALGAAVPKEVWVRRIESLKSIGCNAIRLSHNPQATDLYDVCDSLGMLVKDEAFDEWEYPKKKWITGWNRGEYGYQGSSHYFREWSERDVADMVRRNRNHPSIIMWSIGNEVDYPNDPYSHPILDKERVTQIHGKGYIPSQPNANRIGEIAEVLAAIVRKHDTSRPVTGAMAGAAMSNETKYPSALDACGYNYTEYRYAEDHAKYPNRILYGSENGHSMSAWKAVRDNDYIMGQFLWTGYDYLGESLGWPSRGAKPGLFDFAGNLKPRGYFRRALWSDDAVISVGTYVAPESERALSQLAERLWYYEDGTTIRVVAYTNCEEAELLLDGKVIGERRPYDDNTSIITWDVPFASGELSVRGYNNGEIVATDKIEEYGAPARIVATVDKSSISREREMLHLDIRVVDSEGRLVTLADNEISCEIYGSARLLALESGSYDATYNYQDNRQRCFKGVLLGYIESQGESGKVHLKLTSPMLESCEVEFTVE
ncbi:MAG: glycoside hydrolase family 2 TIM barrel-domain containing protein [Rikenellaceae bacterium]